MLHGEIMVNGHAISQWSARRLTDISDTEAFHLYECRVEREGGRAIAFTLSHRYSDGATVLAQKVLAKALRVEKR